VAVAPVRRRPSIVGLAAALVSGAIAVVYLVLIAQGAVDVASEGAWAYVAVVAAILVGQAAVCGLGAWRVSPRLLASAGPMMLVTGVLALFSIGVPLMIAGLLAVGGAVRGTSQKSTPGG